ncbi:MAG: hypothetical protein ACE149_03510 [Armatimonadota bacterium]
MVWFWSWMLVVGAAVMVGGIAAGRLRRGPGGVAPVPVSRLLLGLVLAAVAFAFCLPSRLPFMAGLGMGYGVLLGAGAAVVAVVAVRLSRPGGQYASRVASAATAGGAAVVWVAVTELVFRGDPGYALIGGIAGGLLAVLPIAWEREELETKAFAFALLVAGLGALLAIGRYQLAPQRAYWGLPTLPLASGLLGLVAGALVFGGARAARWASAALVIVVEAAACFGGRALLARHDQLTVPPQFSALLLIAWAAFILVGLAPEIDGKRLSARMAPALIGPAALIIAFNIAGGYGAALMLAAGLPLALVLWRPGSDSAPFWMLGIGALYLAYRLYLADFGDSMRFGGMVEFGRHYVFLGMVAGLLWIGGARRIGRSAGGVLAMLAALAILPVVLFVGFGYEALLGLILGLWVGWFVVPILTDGGWEQAGLSSAFVALVAVWSLIVPNWAEFVLDQPRWVRGLVVGATAMVVLAVLALMRERTAGPPVDAASAGEG